VSVKDCAPHRPAWSSDGSRLAMLRTTEDCWPWRPSADVCGSDLVVYGLPFDLAGEHDPPARIATGVGSYQQPLWLPGDAELLFTRVSTTGSDPSVDVLIASASGAGVRRIGILKTGDPVVAWGVPGQSILYRVDQPTWNGGGPTAGDLRVFELPTGSDRLIAHDVLAAAFQPAP
jgi:hypothetical protein